MSEHNLHFAFQVFDFNDKVEREDANFVQWEPKLVLSNGATEEE